MEINMSKNLNKELEDEIARLRAENEAVLGSKDQEMQKKEKELEIAKALQKNIQERM